MGKFQCDAQVKPLKFKVINEDDFINQQSDNFQTSDSSDVVSWTEKEAQETTATQRKLTSNFSFESPYPAVVFDQVCFSIDRSQQQANFLEECLYKLNSCFRLNNGQQEQQKVEILKSVNLSVPYGSIFGLLGPSSCGKTTLLRCLVGLLEPDGGAIRLFCRQTDSLSKTKVNSARQRSSDCKVPGSNVGYMPQDLGLYEDFTIRQLLTMFGQYVGMGSKLIAERIQFMAKFLDLPEVDREISSLSGGQKRRVSFAIACLHMPPLIILDEPTVGVDPLLRKSIWKYLRRLADEEKRTIIITTHYIEEAAQADQVALMRAGEILVQDSPKSIMRSNDCKTLEEAFLKICNNVSRQQARQPLDGPKKTVGVYPQTRFSWHNKLTTNVISNDDGDAAFVAAGKIRARKTLSSMHNSKSVAADADIDLNVAVRKSSLSELSQPVTTTDKSFQADQLTTKLDSALNNKLSMAPDTVDLSDGSVVEKEAQQGWLEVRKGSARGFMASGQDVIKSLRESKSGDTQEAVTSFSTSPFAAATTMKSETFKKRINKLLTLTWALLYKNYRRNVNSLPLLAFQFMLPIIQMISFSLCVGGKPSNIGLGLVNLDQPLQVFPTIDLVHNTSESSTSDDYFATGTEELLSTRYLSFLDSSMLSVKKYDRLKDALEDVRRAKLWAAMEIGQNFTTTILQRFDLENFYQLEPNTIQQSVIRLYPDRSNKVLDMICLRSLVNSYRMFLMDQFEHFKKLPLEVKEAVFDIKPNLISNSIDGYTESIAAGLLASLTYIMAAGLTTFIMVVERSAGILERTYTSGISPIAYLLAHALFRSMVMMLQLAVVMFLTFYLLKQPMVGSIGLAYLMLMTLNLTGIAYGLLISSIVTDQNGAALTIVSSLVVKITMSGILWPFEAIPRWLRTICYIQPLTMPVAALKTITLKGNGIEDRTVYLGFVVSLSWLTVFLFIAARRFKFYQH